MQDYQQSKQRLLLDLLGGYCTDINWIWLGERERRRVSFQIDARNRLGFFAEKSHNLIEIKDDQSAEKEISALILPLKIFLKSEEENLYTQAVVTLFDSGLDIVMAAKREPGFVQIQRLVSFAKTNNLNISYRVKETAIPVLSLHKNQIFLSGLKLDVDSDVFLQASRAGLASIIEIIRTEITKPIHVVDLYSGFGTYSFAIHNLIKSARAFEGSKHMIDLLNKNAAAHGFGNKIRGEIRNIYTAPLTVKELQQFDLAIINPPRNGASPQISEIAKSSVKHLIYVSCNPLTFKRDCEILLHSSFQLTKLTAIDQFYKTKHLELVAIFRST